MSKAGIKMNLMMNYFSSETHGRQNIGFTERDVRNFLHTRRMKEFSMGDAQNMLNYLNDIQIKNPHFFYAIQLDVEGKMTNFFWADARSRLDYNYFGDMVYFGPTYGTNKYGMPFIPIVGVNHHLQTILFGCALVLDETEASFVWALEMWMKAMEGNYPKVILTDQDFALIGAIAHVLPTTVHRLCLWHVFQNAMKHLGSLFRRAGYFGKDFSNCVRGFKTIDEFEEDMSTTQRSESSKGFLNRNMTLLDFVQAVNKAITSRREKEIEVDFNMNQVLPLIVMNMQIEEEVATLYMLVMLKKFQEDLIGSLCYRCMKHEEEESTISYKLWIDGLDVKAFIVKVSSVESVMKCSCRKFEFMGILCRHILNVFILTNVQNLQEKYVLKRWTRDAKLGVVNDEKGKQIQEDCEPHLTERYSSLCHEAIEVAAEGSSSFEVYKVALYWLRKAKMEVHIAMKKQGLLNSSENKEKESTHVSNFETQSQTQAHITIQDPLIKKGKGRPGRMKSFSEKKLSKNRKD